MTFIERDGTRREVEAPLGLSVLEIAHKHGVDIEGACEGSLACSTCHVIVDGSWFGQLAEPTAYDTATSKAPARSASTSTVTAFEVCPRFAWTFSRSARAWVIRRASSRREISTLRSSPDASWSSPAT